MSGEAEGGGGTSPAQAAEMLPAVIPSLPLRSTAEAHSRISGKQLPLLLVLRIRETGLHLQRHFSNDTQRPAVHLQPSAAPCSGRNKMLQSNAYYHFPLCRVLTKSPFSTQTLVPMKTGSSYVGTL